MLLRRTSRSPERAIEDLVGMQAQVPGNPYIALWSRLDDFEPDDLSTLISKRGAVRMTLMRATIHLVTADDALALRPVMQPVLERNFYSGSPFGRRIPGADISAILSVGRQLVGEHPRTAAQLRGLLGERWPEEDAEALSMAVRLLVPMVQVPPRGLWKASGQPTWSALEDWLGRPLRGEADVDRVVLRYLAAFGPATVADVRTWSGLGGLRDGEGHNQQGSNQPKDGDHEHTFVVHDTFPFTDTRAELSNDSVTSPRRRSEIRCLGGCYVAGNYRWNGIYYTTTASPRKGRLRYNWRYKNRCPMRL